MTICSALQSPVTNQRRILLLFTFLCGNFSSSCVYLNPVVWTQDVFQNTMIMFVTARVTAAEWVWEWRGMQPRGAHTHTQTHTHTHTHSHTFWQRHKNMRPHGAAPVAQLEKFIFSYLLFVSHSRVLSFEKQELLVLFSCLNQWNTPCRLLKH